MFFATECKVEKFKIDIGKKFEKAGAFSLLHCVSVCLCIYIQIDEG